MTKLNKEEEHSTRLHADITKNSNIRDNRLLALSAGAIGLIYANLRNTSIICDYAILAFALCIMSVILSFIFTDKVLKKQRVVDKSIENKEKQKAEKAQKQVRCLDNWNSYCNIFACVLFFLGGFILLGSIFHQHKFTRRSEQMSKKHQSFKDGVGVNGDIAGDHDRRILSIPNKKKPEHTPDLTTSPTPKNPHQDNSDTSQD